MHEPRFESEGGFQEFAIFSKTTRHLFIPQILHNHCFQFPLGILEVVHREIEDNAMHFFRGVGVKSFTTLFYCSFERAASLPTTCSRFRKSLEIRERTDAKNGLLQWCGHSRVLGISISKTRVIQASPSHITLAIWVRGRVTGEGFESGDAHITVTAPSKRSRTAVRRNSDPVPHTTVK